MVDAIALFKDDSLVAVPGQEEKYSSYGYNLLAAAIQRAAGKPFPQFVEDEIFEPLGLKHTSFDDVRFPLPHRARRYSYYHPDTYARSDKLYVVPTRDYSYNMGGGNIVSTAEDLVRFGRVFVHPGFLTRESLDLLLSPLTPEVESAWTYGWAVRRDDAGRRYLRITGAKPGVQAALLVYPDYDLVVSILSNCWGIGAESAEMVVGLPERVADVLLPPAE